MKMIRQGDVGLIPLSEPPAAQSGLLKDEKRKLIRRGEHGGKHELETLDKATIYKDESLTGQLFGRYVHVTDETRVVHNEHAAVTLAPGWYEIRIQRQWTEGGARQVLD